MSQAPAAAKREERAGKAAPDQFGKGENKKGLEGLPNAVAEHNGRRVPGMSAPDIF